MANKGPIVLGILLFAIVMVLALAIGNYIASARLENNTKIISMYCGNTEIGKLFEEKIRVDLEIKELLAKEELSNEELLRLDNLKQYSENLDELIQNKFMLCELAIGLKPLQKIIHVPIFPGVLY